MKTLFFVEITDTFGGDANYSWVTRHVIKAKSPRGAACALSRRSGLNWRYVGCDRYDSKSGATCAFIREYDSEYDGEFKFSTDDRGAKMKEQFNPFPEVSSRYGAPMGRKGDNPANLQGVKRLHARRQGGGAGYDKGGAYWGLPSNVYGVWAHIDGETVCTYVRANSRIAAIEKIKAGK